MNQPSSELTTEQTAAIELAPTSARHRLFRAERARVALDVLAERTTAIDLDDLATAVAECETTDAPDENEVQRVAISLHHRHLPKMAEADVVEYDADANRVEPLTASPG